VDDKTITVLSARTPEEIPWRELGVDIVLESTGKMVEVLHRNFGIQRGMMTTTHSYTTDQSLIDMIAKTL
jgi:glyceraldehyde-3-phosphate dehydrogenase/erythrose-4-phosphate dehydrogenase